MGYLAIYRKYRPTTFDAVIGQEHITRTLINQIRHERLGHAYLFTGSRGTGKTSTAKIFAKAINCLNNKNGSPCGECECCKALSQSSNLDIIEIDAASNNGVNEIRELRENVQFPPVSCKYKVYIIDEVHMLTGPAFNALLKTLEEPPKHAIFILATTEVHKIPATILSRCMRFDFRLIPTEKIVELICSIFDSLGKKYDKEAVLTIASAAEGSVRDALSIADTAFSYSDEKLSYEDVLEILGSTNVEYLIEFIKSIIDSDAGKVLTIIEKLSSLGKSFGMLIKDVENFLRNLIIIKCVNNAGEILGIPESQLNNLKNICNTITKERLLYILNLFTTCENDIRYSSHPRILFETASIKATSPEIDYSIDALLLRIKDLEEKLCNYSFMQPDKEALSKDNTNVVNSDEKFNENNIKTSDIELQSLENLTNQELKGKLLNGLIQVKSEMLWNVIQNVDVSFENGIIKIQPKTESDRSILLVKDNVSRLEEALSNYSFEKILIEELNNKKLDRIDDTTERLKKLFGEDIVIIKK